MTPAEVLAIEIKQFSGGGKTTLVPRVIGASFEAEAKKKPGGTSVRQWDEKSFFDSLTQARGAPDSETALTILDWAQKEGLKVWWGRGNVEGGYTLYLKDNRGTHNSVKIMNSGKIEVSTVHMRGQPPFDSESLRLEFVKRMNQIPGASIPTDKLSGYPTFPLSALHDPDARSLFFDAMTWFITQVRQSATNTR